MRSHTVASEEPPWPLRPLRVLIEDPALADDVPPSPTPFDVTVCAGPAHEAEVCPLVLEGRCPLGSFDVVVGALDGPWERSVRAAWGLTSTPYVDDCAGLPQDPEARLTHHLGAALQQMFDPGDDPADR